MGRDKEEDLAQSGASAIGDQDDTYTTYIRPNWPDIEYRQFTGGPNYGYGAQLSAQKENAAYFTSAWMQKNITGRGPLGAIYRVWGDGKQMVKDDKLDYFGLAGYTDEQLKKMGYVVWMPVQEKGSWLGEGDTGTFMSLPGNGLDAYEANSPGGWGGRIMSKQETTGFGLPGLDSMSKDTSAKSMATAITSLTQQMGRNAQGPAYPNFFPTAQLDFASRLKWAVTPKYADANHPPAVKIIGPQTVLASPGDKIRVSASIADPDGNAVAVKWWQFATESNTKTLIINNPASAQTEVMIPKDAIPGQTIYLILEATDNGTPAITRYRRLNIMIKK